MPRQKVLIVFTAIESVLTLALMVLILLQLPLLPVLVSFVVLTGINSVALVMRVRKDRGT